LTSVDPITARPHWTDRPRIAEAREQWPVLDTALLAVRRFSLHRTGRNGALVAHYGFLSIFPLILVFTTVLGFLLDGNTKLQQRILDTVIAQVPLIGDQLLSDPTQLQGSVPLLVFGLLTATWSGMRAFNVLQTALDDVDDVPFDARPSLVRVRLRSLLGIGLAGCSLIGGAVLSGFASMAGVDWRSRLLLGVGTWALNTLMLAGVYRWLSTRQHGWRHVTPGAVAAGFAFTALQLAGSTVMTRAITHASPIYGTFATVIGLLFWLSLHAIISLLGAELNGVLAMHRVRVR
jgi:YihY family inner membrane protein